MLTSIIIHLGKSMKNKIDDEVDKVFGILGLELEKNLTEQQKIGKKLLKLAKQYRQNERH